MDELMIFASRISNIIIKNEDKLNTLINWSSLLESYGFKTIYEKYSIIDNHQSWNNPEYEGTINKIFLECIKENKKSSEIMLNDILTKLDITKNQMSEIFNTKFKFIDTEPQNEINPVVFISYSSKDKVDFDKLTRALNEIGFESFIAKEDIKLSELWKNKIIKQLNESDIIIAILSDNFMKSNYCNHELGIAIHRNMLIIPLSIDNKESYGLFEKFQSRPFEKYLELQEAIIEYYTPQTINYFLNRINIKEYNGNYDSCNILLKLMNPYFKKFSDNQIDKLVNAVLINNQMHGRYGKPYLKNFYDMYENKIPLEKRKEFKKYI